MMHYAVNMADMMGASAREDVGLKMLLLPVLDEDQIVECEKKRIDGASIAIACEPDRAAAIVEIIRKKYKKHELRIYQSRTGQGGWKRL